MTVNSVSQAPHHNRQLLIKLRVQNCRLQLRLGVKFLRVSQLDTKSTVLESPVETLSPPHDRYPEGWTSHPNRKPHSCQSPSHIGCSLSRIGRWIRTFQKAAFLKIAQVFCYERLGNRCTLESRTLHAPSRLARVQVECRCPFNLILLTFRWRAKHGEQWRQRVIIVARSLALQRLVPCRITHALERIPQLIEPANRISPWCWVRG